MGCLRGTRILTPTGAVPVEQLAIGDTVVTRFGGIQAVIWIGRQTHDSVFSGDGRDNNPVCIRAGALGHRLPARDLFVSPGHAMLVNGTLILARALVNGVTITWDHAPPRIHYYQIELATHDCVVAEGTWSETFADGPGLREHFHNAAEFESLYPEKPPPQEPKPLCAPQPLRGERLDAVLRPVVARVPVVKPGLLRGSIDRVAPPFTIEGWAQDEAYPELPVLLEILIGDPVVSTALACDYRQDLAAVGLARGRCAFLLKSPLRLTRETAGTVRIRRASDHAELMMSPECRSRLGAMAETPARTGLRLVK